MASGPEAPNESAVPSWVPTESASRSVTTEARPAAGWEVSAWLVRLGAGRLGQRPGPTKGLLWGPGLPATRNN